MSRDQFNASFEQTPESDEVATPETGSTRKNQVYQLFVLGKLMDKPMHGYLLRDLLSNVLGPFRQISWGALYPLFRQLERDGSIELDVEDASKQDNTAQGTRHRKRYRITEAGKVRFYSIMQEQGEYTIDTPELFTIKVINFGRISHTQQVAILQHYLGYLRTLENALQMQSQRKANRKDISLDEIANVQRAIRHRSSAIQGELQWVTNEIAQITEESFRAT